MAMVTKSGILGVTILLLPVLELVALLVVGGVLGILNTIVVFVGLSVAGAWLLRVRLAGAAASLMTNAPAGDVPRSVASSALAILGAALVMLPGFITGAVGLVLQLGPVRNLVAPKVTGQFTATVGSVGGRFVRADVIDVDLAGRSEGRPPHWPSPSPGELERSNRS